MYNDKIDPNQNKNYSNSKNSVIPEIGLLYKLTKSHEYQKDKADILENITQENHCLKKGSLNQILDLIDERILERDKQLYEIDKAICDLHTQQFQLEAVYSDINKRLKTTLDQTCSKLDIEKAKAKTDAWQDTMKLRKELIPLITEYMSSIRKMEILNENYKPFKASGSRYTKEKLPEFPVRMP